MESQVQCGQGTSLGRLGPLRPAASPLLGPQDHIPSCHGWCVHGLAPCPSTEMKKQTILHPGTPTKRQRALPEWKQSMKSQVCSSRDHPWCPLPRQRWCQQVPVGEWGSGWGDEGSRLPAVGCSSPQDAHARFFQLPHPLTTRGLPAAWRVSSQDMVCHQGPFTLCGLITHGPATLLASQH